jgi:homoserine acetyltransferase
MLLTFLKVILYVRISYNHILNNINQQIQSILMYIYHNLLSIIDFNNYYIYLEVKNVFDCSNQV